MGAAHAAADEHDSEPDEGGIERATENERWRAEIEGVALPGSEAATTRDPAARWREVVLQVVEQQGGPVYCSQVKRQLIRRLATVTVLAEKMESDAQRGLVIDAETYARLADLTERLAARIEPLP